MIAIGYNFAGYGRVVLGQYGEAVNKLGKHYFHAEDRFEARHAGTLNNLGRALASLGREERGYRVCADGLNMRRFLGAEIPNCVFAEHVGADREQHTANADRLAGGCPGSSHLWAGKRQPSTGTRLDSTWHWSATPG